MMAFGCEDLLNLRILGTSDSWASAKTIIMFAGPGPWNFWPGTQFSRPTGMVSCESS